MCTAATSMWTARAVVRRAAQALGADAQGVDPLQQLLLHFGVEGSGGTWQGEEGPAWPAPPSGQSRRHNAHAHHNGRTGVGACFATVLNTKSLTPWAPSEGRSMAMRLIFSLPAPLGGHGDLQPVAGHQTDVQDGRGCCPWCLPGAGGPATTEHQACFQIALVDACVDRLLQVSWMWTSWPTSRKTQATPVSWQIGSWSSSAIL